eukprot:3852839-Amphidinium_carterae.1
MDQLQQFLQTQTQAFTQALQQTQAVMDQQAQSQAASTAQMQQVIQAQQDQMAILQAQMGQLTSSMGEMMRGGSAPVVPASSPPGEFRMPGGEADELKSIIHPSLIEKAERHDGQESTFPAWKFQFEALAALIGMDKQVEMSPTTSDADLALLNLDEDAEKKAKALWFLLVRTQSVKGLNILQVTEKFNGFLAWKRICREFLPEAGGRYNALLTALLHPDWSKGDFDVNRAIWEKNIVMYESESGEKFTSRMRIATVCKYAPTSFSESVKVAAMTSMTDYGKFSDALKSAVLTTKSYSFEGGVIPMDVGGIQGQGKGKGSGAGDLCHFC